MNEETSHIIHLLNNVEVMGSNFSINECFFVCVDTSCPSSTVFPPSFTAVIFEIDSVNKRIVRRMCLRFCGLFLVLAWSGMMGSGSLS